MAPLLTGPDAQGEGRNGRPRREVDPRSAGTLFQLARDGRPRTRADLAASTGLARPTVAVRIEELLSTGLIVPAGEASSSGGRPPATFAFNPGARLILVADLGAHGGRLAVTDLASTVLAQASLEVAIAEGPEVVLDAVRAALEGLVGELGRPLSDVAGVGIGVPGPVEHRLGRAISPPIMPGWDSFDVPGHLRQWLPVPILVDNDVNIMALGEHAAQWPDVADLVFIKIATGIGAGIISDGELRRGALGAAGDLGHIAVPHGRQVSCRCGNLGCLEALASGQAVVESLRAQGNDIEHTSQIIELVRAGNVTAIQAVRQAGRDIGDVVAGVVNLLNPSVIVLGGVISEVGEHLLAGIREIVYSRSLPLATQHLRIVSSQTDGLAGVLGASQMVAQQVLSAPAIDALVTDL